MRKKKCYVAERITNIRQLEKMLQRESNLIQDIKTELKKKQISNEKLNALLKNLEETNQKAVRFEFCLERRKTYI